MSTNFTVAREFDHPLHKIEFKKEECHKTKV